MLKFLSIKLFLISFAIGIFFVYIMGVEPKIINIYPSPEVIDKYLLQDKADNCFKYEKQEVKCPINPDDIAEIPIQE